MHDGRSTLERAFELAREGRCRSVGDIRRKLSAERHDRVEDHLSGTAIRKQLRLAIATAARTDAAEGTT
jgi:hypothetical protein